jgi:hypothetical protein
MTIRRSCRAASQQAIAHFTPVHTGDRRTVTMTAGTSAVGGRALNLASYARRARPLSSNTIPDPLTQSRPTGSASATPHRPVNIGEHHARRPSAKTALRPTTDAIGPLPIRPKTATFAHHSAPMRLF